MTVIVMNNSWESVFTDAGRFQRPTTSHQQPFNRIEPVMINSDDDDSRDSGHGDSNNMDVYIDTAMDEYFRKLASRENRLVLETTYPLNYTSKVIVGCSPIRDFTPVIKLVRDDCIAGGIVEDGGVIGGKKSIVIPIEDWDSIVAYFMNSVIFLNDSSSDDDGDGDVQVLKPHTIFDFTLSQQIFLDRKYIKIETHAANDEDAQCIYLSADSVLALISLMPIVNSHLCRLKHLDLQETYSKILHMMTNMVEPTTVTATNDSIIVRFKMFSSLSLEPSVETAMLEIVRFHASKLYNDYERYVKSYGVPADNQSVKSSSTAYVAVSPKQPSLLLH